MPGTLILKIGHTGQHPEGERRAAVCNYWFESPLYVILNHPVGQLDRGRLWLWRLGMRPLAPSGCGRGYQDRARA
jgi:hypothetical protein